MTLDPTQVRYLRAVNDGDLALAEELGAAMDEMDDADAARLDHPATLGSAAHYYASHGVAVFPLRPRDKIPLAGSHGLLDATTDVVVVAAQWAMNPDANIGARTGLTFDVLDVDGPTGVNSIWGNDGANLPRKRLGHSQTARDGGHHLFVLPNPRVTTDSEVLPGVDYRGAGGYVVLPPSVGANGRRYRWVTPLSVS